MVQIFLMTYTIILQKLLVHVTDRFIAVDVPNRQYPVQMV